MSGPRFRTPQIGWAFVVWGVLLAAGAGLAQAPAPAKGVAFPTVDPEDLKAWLTYLSADELDGRQVFTEGYGIAAQFIAERLREWGVKPLGDAGTYFQIVKVQSYRVERRSSVVVEVRGERLTFRDGDHVIFPPDAGGRQTLVFNGVEVAGAPTPVPEAGGKLVLVLTPSAASAMGEAAPETLAWQAAGAGATIQYAGTAPLVATDAERRADLGPTPERVDRLVPPQLTVDSVFLSALLSGVSGGVSDVEARLSRGQAAPLHVPDVKVTIQVDNTYEPLTTRRTRNVIGMVEGTDARLKDTYVLFGAHLDHVGYAVSNDDARGRVNNAIETDRVWNGADDDGTGTTAELAIAKAFAQGPKPRRSVVFLWHAGEEAGLYGSRYNAAFPVVPLDRVQCLLNIDMIGRNRDDDPRQANSVFVIGADRISTDLHNLIVDTNASLPNPMTLNYEYNDPRDSNSFYTRSDQYSYASKGVPIAFFFTGTHADYHANSDSVDKILFGKQARVAQLVYETGFAAADTDRPLRRDRRGPRAGVGFHGKLN